MQACHFSAWHMLPCTCAGVRLDWVTANLEVLLPHPAAASVQGPASALLQPYGFTLLPGSAGPSTSTSSCCSQAPPAVGVHLSTAGGSPPLPAAAAGAGAGAGEQQPAPSSSYDLLIKASSNPAALLGRLLENAPNLARTPSSRGSVAPPAGSTPVASPVKPSRLKPAPGQQLSVATSTQQAQQQRQQQEAEAIVVDVSRLPEADAAASSSAGAAEPAAGAAALAAGLPATREPGVSDSYKFSIEGMSCGSCVKSVESSVAQVCAQGVGKAMSYADTTRDSSNTAQAGVRTKSLRAVCIPISDRGKGFARLAGNCG